MNPRLPRHFYNALAASILTNVTLRRSSLVTWAVAAAWSAWSAQVCDRCDEASSNGRCLGGRRRREGNRRLVLAKVLRIYQKKIGTTKTITL